MRASVPANGFTYLEVLVVVAVLAAALAPMLGAMTDATGSAAAAATELTDHYELSGRIEQTLALDYPTLLAAATLTRTKPSALSDPAGLVPRLLVYVTPYDATNDDADGNPYTLTDPDTDDDDNLLTGYTGALEVSVKRKGTITKLATLVVP